MAGALRRWLSAAALAAVLAFGGASRVSQVLRRGGRGDAPDLRTPAPRHRHRPAAASAALLVSLLSARGQFSSSADAVFALDANGDGGVDRVEFVSGLCQKTHLVGVDAAQDEVCDERFFMNVFDIADADSNGVLSREEAATVLDKTEVIAHTAATDLLDAMFALYDFASSEQEFEGAVLLVEEIASKAKVPATEESLLGVAVMVLLDKEWLFLDASIVDWLLPVFRACDLDRGGFLEQEDLRFMAAGARRWWDDGLWQLSQAAGDEVGRDAAWEAEEYDDESGGDGEGIEDAVQGTLNELDIDGDGRVHWQEYMDAAESVNPSQVAMARAMVLFARADWDNDSNLDQGELASLLSVAYARPARRA